VLSAIRVPTLVIHQTDDTAVSAEGGRFLAQHIPQARLAEFPGADHLPYICENSDNIIDEIEDFMTGSRHAVEADRILTTVMLTDIVNSTKRASELVDRRWRALLDQHDALVRQELSRLRGREVKALGGRLSRHVYGPARAVRCAAAIVERVRSLDLQAQCGLHTGEIELQGKDIAGIAVHIAARIAAQAQGDQVLVSSTVRDLVAGSGLRFVDEGVQSLKGIPEEVRVFSVDG
jgi:class 3 adenylate cyclase